MSLKACLFDLGNVLVHFCHDRMCRQLAELAGTDAEALRSWLLESGLQWEFERGLISEFEFAKRFEAKFTRSHPHDDLLAASSDIFTLNEPMMPLLDELHRQGLRLVLLSNTSPNHIRWIERHFDVLRRLDQLVLSYEVGAPKPEAAIYRAALDAAGVEPQHCFYTDDVPEYVRAARQLGIHADVFTDAQRCRDALRRLGVDV